jgi:hypothetical protein
MSIEIPVIIRGKRGVRPEFSGKHPARKRHTSEYTNLPPLRVRKEIIRRTLAEAIEDDLHCLDVRVLNGFESLFYFLYADSVVADFPGPNQIVENSEYLSAVVQGRRGAMELQQIQRVSRKISQTVFDPACKVFATVAFDGLLREAAPCFGRDENFFPAMLL